MYKKTVVTLAIAGVLGVTAVVAQASTRLAMAIAGTYHGEVLLESIQPVATTWSVDASGRIGGHYRIGSGDSAIVGSLRDCHSDDEESLACHWQDGRGSGMLHIAFSADRSGFEGAWTVDGASDGASWNGKR